MKEIRHIQVAGIHQLVQKVTIRPWQSRSGPNFGLMKTSDILPQNFQMVKWSSLVHKYL